MSKFFLLYLSVPPCLRGEQTDPAAAIADHLAKETAEPGTRSIVDADLRGEEAAEPRPVNPVIELDILAGVETLVEFAHLREDFTLIGNGDTAGLHELTLRGVDE